MDYVEADRIFWEIYFPEGEDDDCSDEPQPSTVSNDDGLDGDF